MGVYLAPVLAGLMMVAAPGADRAPGEGGVALTQVELLSAVAGQILGAATVCEQITDARLSAAAVQVSGLVSAVATDDDELVSAKQMFEDNANAGKQAVQNGRADCTAVEASLIKLERLRARPAD